VRKLLIITLSLLVIGCGLFQAPTEIQVLKPIAGKEIKHYQRKMGVVASKTTSAYQKSETTRIKDNHWRELKEFQRLHPEQFTPVYVKAQTIVLLDKLSKVNKSADAVKLKVSEVNIHIDRAVQILELFGDWMSTGFDKGDADAVKRFFEESSEKWLEIEKERLLQELENEVSRLEDQLEEAEAEGESD